jgi:NADP-dependent 3-hydroxy acid dehydrogenase YdfG
MMAFNSLKALAAEFEKAGSEAEPLELDLTNQQSRSRKRINASKAIAFAIEQPVNIDVNEIVVRPTAQPT